ncbi:MAG: hypothetical protein RSC04_00085 [Bacteroidales bacterium]
MQAKFLKNLSILLCIGFTLMLSLSSCKYGKIDELENENNKLKNEIVTSDSIQIQFMNAYAEIEYNLSEIKIKEKIISDANAQNTENGANIQQKILQDINDIGRLMNENRRKIANLEAMRRQLVSAKKLNANLVNENQQLRHQLSQKPSVVEVPAPIPSSIEEEQARLLAESKRMNTENKNTSSRNQQLINENKRLTDLSNGLNDMITRLKNQVIESEARIESLQEELFLMKDAYAALEVIADSLRTQNGVYRIDIEKKDVLLANQSTVYYIVGKINDLKSKGLLTRSGLSSELNESVFTKTDMNTLNSITTNSKKMLLLSSHPAASYSINTSDPKNLKLEIKNPALFWKNTKFAVIAIK